MINQTVVVRDDDKPYHLVVTLHAASERFIEIPGLSDQSLDSKEPESCKRKLHITKGVLKLEVKGHKLRGNDVNLVQLPLNASTLPRNYFLVRKRTSAITEN